MTAKEYAVIAVESFITLPKPGTESDLRLIIELVIEDAIQEILNEYKP